MFEIAKRWGIMDFFNKLNKVKGGYIFLSHSHDDIEKVREIRNNLERDGFEPLCFYLKCLDDDSEIEDLIKREIDAREWFVFVNSENSRKSKWVTLEREYITSTDNKKIITVDIDNEQSIAETIQKISHNLRVFISYSRVDETLARQIKKHLTKRDYLVWTEEDMTPDLSWCEQTLSKIEEASKDGCVIVLVTPNSVDSRYVLDEMDFAWKQNGNFIPIIVGDVELSREFEYYLYKRKCYYISNNPTDDEINEMIEKIGQDILSK